MIASVVIVIISGSVPFSQPVQDRSDNICARLLKEADGALDGISRSFASLDDEANPVKIFCQQEGVAYGIDRRRIDNDAIVVAEEPLERRWKMPDLERSIVGLGQWRPAGMRSRFSMPVGATSAEGSLTR